MIPINDEDAMLEKLREKLGPTKKVDERSELERLFGKREQSQEDKLRKKLVKPAVKNGDIVDLNIEKIAYGGDGLGRHGSLPVFVPDTVPGDAVRIRITNVSQDRCTARLIEHLARSSNRVQPRCPLFGRCGGCQIQSLVYTAQLKTKEIMVSDLVKKIAGIDTRVRSVIRSPEPYGYRIRTRLQVAIVDQVVKVGYFARKSKDLVPFEQCPLLADILSSVCKILPDVLPKAGTAPLPAEIQLQTNLDADDVLIHLRGPEPILYCDAVLERCIELGLPVIGVSSDAGSQLSRAGKTRISQEISNFVFNTSSNTFIQANRYLMRKMIDQAIMLCSPAAGDEVLDLYCGSGFFSLPIARFVKSMIGLEGNPTSINDARDASLSMTLENTSFYCSEDNRFFASKSVKNKSFSLIIIDPPRSGIEKNVMKNLIRLKPPKLLYISCNPSTMARDLRILSDADFKVRVIQPIDLFPHTFHIENMVFLTHRYTGTQAANQVFMDLH